MENNNKNDLIENQLSTSASGIIGGFKIAIDKMNNSFSKQIFLGIIGGAILALAYTACIYAQIDITSAGIKSLINGVIFPAGIILITFVGGGLFTSHVVAMIPTIKGAIKVNKFIVGIFGVFIGNFIGAFIIAGLAEISGILSTFNNVNTAFTNTALGIAFTKLYLVGNLLKLDQSLTMKATLLSMLMCFGSGILCNLLVSATIPAVKTTNSDITKLVLMFFLIVFFIVSGYQHSPANTFIFWILFFESINKAQILNHTILFSDCIYFLIFNLIFCFFGNFVGGGLLTPGILTLINKKHVDNFFLELKQNH